MGKIKNLAVAILATLVFATCPMEGGGNSENGSDLTPPGEVTSLKTGTLADGAITVTWTDPEDGDLGYVLCMYAAEGRDGYDAQWAGGGYGILKGNQTLTLANLNGGTEYTITVKTVDLTGNRSEGVTVKVTP